MKWVDTLHKLLLQVVVIIFGLLCGITMLQVIMRYVIGHALMWGDELARFLMVWGVFIAGGLAFYYRRHLALDYVIQKLPLLMQKLLRTVIWLFIFVLGGFYFINGYNYAMENWVQIMPTLGIPKTFVFISLPFSAILWIIFGINDLYLIWIERAVPTLGGEEHSVDSEQKKEGE